VTTAEPIETINDCMVASVAGAVAILNPPLGPMDRDKALRLAAWLVAVADPGGERFAEIRKAVLST
jgi:hypothetical protein